MPRRGSWSWRAGSTRPTASWPGTPSTRPSTCWSAIAAGGCRASCTQDVPLVGAEGYQARWNQRQEIAAASGVHVARIEHLLHRYGDRAQEVLTLVAADPDLGRPLEGAEDYLRAEVVHSASHEGARHLDDMLTRRMRVSIETWDRGVTAAEPAARLMAGVLGWTEEQVHREVEHYRLRVTAEIDSQAMPDDERPTPPGSARRRSCRRAE